MAESHLHSCSDTFQHSLSDERKDIIRGRFNDSASSDLQNACGEPNRSSCGRRHRTVRYLLGASLVSLLSLLMTGRNAHTPSGLHPIPTFACEQDSDDHGDLEKTVEVDKDKKILKITVKFKKKGNLAGKRVRVIEMIGPKDWPYNDRVLIGGHKVIPTTTDEMTLEWTITIRDRTKLRQGSIATCGDCHSAPDQNHAARSLVCSNCHNDGRKPPLDEWNDTTAGDGDPAEFDELTEEEFNQWITAIADKGYAQYIDFVDDTQPTETTGPDWTSWLEVARQAQESVPEEFDFFPHNHSPIGQSFRMAADTTQLPPGWAFATVPAVGTPFFLAVDEILYAEAFLTPPSSVPTGQEARVTLFLLEDTTGTYVGQSFAFRMVKDLSPPIISPPTFTVESLQGVIRTTVADQPAKVREARIVHRLDDGPLATDLMDVEGIGTACNPISWQYRLVLPYGEGHHFEYHIVATDAVGNVSVSPTQNVLLPSVSARGVPAMSTWGLAVLVILLFGGGALALIFPPRKPERRLG